MDSLSLIFPAIALGGIWGSFLGVLSVRIPEGESVISPPSRCDSCKTPLKFREMIPLVSWILLKGRCQTCQHAMPFEVPVSEMAAAIFFGILASLHLPMLHSVVLLLFFTFALPLTLIDIRFHRLPHLLTISAIAVGLVISSKFLGGQGFFLSFSGAVLGFLPVAIVAILYKKGIGMGDAFWLAAIGAFAGPDSLPEVLLIASGTGIIAALAFRTFHNSFKNQPIWGLAIPFGPFLSLGGIVALWNPDSMNSFTIYLK